MDNDEGEEMHLRKIAEQQEKKKDPEEKSENDQDTGSSPASRES